MLKSLEIKGFTGGNRENEIRNRYFKPDVIKKKFHLPENLEPINILVIGYSDETGADPERHGQSRISVEELVSMETL